MAIIDDYLLNRSSEFQLNNSEEERTDLILSQSVATTGGIRGTVTNSVTGSAVANATVKIRTQSGDPVIHTQTNASGNYSIDAIESGTYAINVTMPKFRTSQAQIFTVWGGPTLVVNVAITPETLSLNTIFGKVTDISTGAPISGVDVVLIQDVGVGANAIATKSNADGEYIIDQIPDGTRTLVASFSGYYLSSFIPITISGGIIINTDISLQPWTLPSSTVNGYIKDQYGSPIANSCVGLYLIDSNGIEILQQITFTDATGFYIFGRATAGNYVVKAKSQKVATTV